MAQNIVTQFLISAAVTPAFSSSIGRANRELLSLQRSIAGASTSLAGMGKGLLTLAGIGAGTASLSYIFGKSVEYAKREQSLVAAIGVGLQNVNRQLGLNSTAWGWMTADIEKQSMVLEQQSGIYHQTYLQAAAILEKYHFSHAAVVATLGSTKELLAYQRLSGKTEEETLGVYEAIGKTVEGLPMGAAQLAKFGITLDN